jgi:hypothetical protein
MVSVSAPPDRPSVSPAPEAPPEPNSVLSEVAGEAEMPLPSNPQTFFLGGIFALGVFAALYEARSVILPVVKMPGAAGQPISRIHELIEIMAAGRRPDTKYAPKK